MQARSAQIRDGPGSNQSQSLMTCNFAALLSVDPKFLVFNLKHNAWVSPHCRLAFAMVLLELLNLRLKPQGNPQVGPQGLILNPGDQTLM